MGDAEIPDSIESDVDAIRDVRPKKFSHGTGAGSGPAGVRNTSDIHSKIIELTIRSDVVLRTVLVLLMYHLVSGQRLKVLPEHGSG